MGTELQAQNWAGKNLSNDSFGYLTTYRFRDCGGTLFFAVSGGNLNDAQVALSGGTSASTRLLREFNPDATIPTDPDEFTKVDNYVFFVANDPLNGRELWKVDLVNNYALSLVKNIRPGNYSSSPHSLAECNGKLVFACNADDGYGYGDELYVSDGTEAGTHLLKDIVPNGGSSNIGTMTTIGSFTYFDANSPSGGGSVPWRTDGTTNGTVQLSSSGTVYKYPGTFTSFKGSVYFFMKDSTSGNAYALWRTDGTPSGTTVVKSPVTGGGSDGGVTRPDVAVVANNLLFFRGGSSTTGYELWKSDGNANGTTLVKDVKNGSGSGLNSSYGSKSELVSYNGKCVFVADDGIQGRQLWQTDGTTTTMLGPTFASKPPTPNSLIVFNNKVFFRMHQDAYGEEWWTTDGTTNPSTLAIDIYQGSKDGLAGPTFVHDGDQVVIGSNLFFVGTDLQYGKGLWRIGAPLTITTQPQSRLIAAGTGATFTVAATSPSPISYTWRKNGIDISGATAASYSIASATLAQAGSYQVLAESDDGSAASAVAKLGVVDTNVLPKSALAGGTVSLAIAATAPAGTTLGYQWKRGGTPLANGSTTSGGTISGANGPVLTITKLGNTEVGSYTCTVTMDALTLTSQAAAVSIAVLPVVNTQPISRLVKTGTSLTFTVVAASNASLSYQWKLNGASIAGATAASYTISSVQLSHAGEYRCTLTNPGGSVNSNAARLGVIADVPTGSSLVNVIAGGAITPITAGLAFPSTATVTYQWRRNTVAIADGTNPSGSTYLGTNARQFSIFNASLSDAGYYTCTVGMDGLSLTIGVFDLLVKSKPTITNTIVPPAIISGSYSWQITSVGGVTRYRITGLPPGLIYNSITGLISGIPTRSGVFKVVVVGTNEVGTGLSASFNLVVPALPAQQTGNFSAVIGRSRAINGKLGGQLILSVLSNGTYTGTIANGVAPMRISGRVISSVSGDPQIDLVLRRTGLLDLHLSVTIVTVNDTLTGSLSDGTDSATISGGRHVWSKTNPSSAYAGAFNASTDLSGAYSSDIYPQGRGWLQATVGNTGGITGAGRLGDGTAFTLNASLWANTNFPLFALLYSGRGSISGQPRVTLGVSSDAGEDRIAATFAWFKMPDSTGKERQYAAGFEIPDAALAGSRWAAPAPGQMIMAWPNKANNTKTVAIRGGLTSPQLAALGQIFTLGANGISLFDKTQNSEAMTFTVSPKTGLYSGNFLLTDPIPGSISKYSRTVTFSGLMIRHLNRGYGWFNVPQLPQAGQTLLTSPILTGRIDVIPQ